MKKRAPGCLGFIGDEQLPSYLGIIINHEIRIPINQPGFHGMSFQGLVHVAHLWALRIAIETQRAQ